MGRREDIRKKIMDRVVLTKELFEGTPCHIWSGPTSGTHGRGHSYPRMNLDGQTVAVHRVSWTNEHGFIPGKKQLDHRCPNRTCVNEAHLALTTHKQNCKLRDLRRKKP
jgi:hypothetical protein